MLAREQALERFPQVDEDMPAVGNLGRTGRPATGAVGVGTGPITGDDLHPRVRLEPGRERGGRALGQQIDGGMPFLVNQNRPIRAASLTSPVIDAEHAGLRHRWKRESTHEPQEGGATDRTAQRFGQARSWSTTQRHTDVLQRPSEQRATTRIPWGQVEYLLSEGPPWTGLALTQETTNTQVHHHLPLAERLVRNAAGIAAVDVARTVTTGWAPGCGSHPVGFDMDDAIKNEGALDTETSELWKEIGNTQMGTSEAVASP